MKDVRFAKFVLLINGLVPGALLLWDWYHGNAGANPVNYAIRTTGLLTLIFLCLTLLVTPLRKLTGWNWLFHLRRRLGLFAFFYALAHFSIFFGFDRALSIQSTLSEMVKRPYLIVGSIGLFSMLPLAITSTNAMIRRLGPKRWQALHRLVYLTAIAGVIHFYMQVKSDTRMPIAFGIVVGLLLGYRLQASLRKRSTKPAPANMPSDGRWTGQLRVQSITAETPDVRTFRLVPADGGPFPFTHLPGQYLTLTLFIDGKTIRRSYTIASTPSRAGYCELTIKREEKGVVSRHMHDVIKEGDTLMVTAPGGKFTFTGTEAPAIALLAAGVGITPLMSIARYLTDQNWSGHIYLIFSNKTEPDIIFRKEIELLQQRFPNLHVTLTLTRVEGASWTGCKGRISAELIRQVIPNPTAIPFYLCGPAEMLTATRTLLRDLGVPESSIHTESFGTRPTAAETGAMPGEQFTVIFSRSGKSAKLASTGRPILYLAEDLGVEVDSECRSGICGRCKCTLLSGSVAMETQDALDDADRKVNKILLCQAHPLEDVTVSV